MRFAKRLPAVDLGEKLLRLRIVHGANSGIHRRGEPMIVTMIPYCPQHAGKNLGFAYNELMGRIREDDWACFIDHDACFTTEDWYLQLEEIATTLSAEPCVLTAVTNRVGSTWQLAAGVDRNNHSMDYHRRIGKGLQSAARTNLRDVTNHPLMSGVVVLLSRKTWLRVGGFVDGFLGVDNALHQAARDHGCRVYLMEGVYVYHWYRADAAATPHERECNTDRRDRVFNGSIANGEIAPDPEFPAGPREPFSSVAAAQPRSIVSQLHPSGRTWGRLSVYGRHVLLIGHDVMPLASSLNASGPAALTVVEVEQALSEDGNPPRDHAYRIDDEGNGAEFPDESFDTVIAYDLIESVRRPESILGGIRRWLAADGNLFTSFRTVRSLPIVEGLLTGRWLAASQTAGTRPPLRFYTRREVEKLLFRTGFTIDTLEPIPGSNNVRQPSTGPTGQFQLGNLCARGLPKSEIDEFYSDGFHLQASPRPEAAFAKTSIVIVTCNQIEFTRQCVDSIRRMTDEPYELIFVDNGSNDGTPEYLETIAEATVIRNRANRGFPAAANQGIGAAVGEQILLLNNDTIVTTGWLQRLLNAMATDPQIGLVGPCSNFVGSEQQVEINYSSLAGLDGFAWDWGKLHDREIEESSRLIGFCLLIRRAAADNIGSLDERFGLGCFEDDDYCLRAIRAGWRAVIARDAFVHHFGGRTFLGNNIDHRAVLLENEQKFRDKWPSHQRFAVTPQPEVPRLPRRPPPSGGKECTELVLEPAAGRGLLLRRKSIRLSLCMIVRDSARTLRPCLASIRPWVDEIVVVDTGSKDETQQIAKQFDARLFHFPWCDDFSAARNESLRHARGDWLFWMDSDDTIPAECGQQLRALADGEHAPDLLGFVMQVHCPGGQDGAGPESDATIVDHIKLFRNRSDLRFDGRIHEQILPSITRAGGSVAWSDVYVVHSGSDPSTEAQDRKRQRDLRLLHLELRERPKHPFTLFNLGMTYVDGGHFEEAEPFLLRSIQNSNPNESHLRKAYAFLVCAQSQLGRRDEALESCRTARQLFPNDAELRFREAGLLHQAGRLHEAVQAYRDVLANHEAKHFSSVDRSLTGYKAWQNLAVVYSDMGDLERAAQSWREVVKAVPDYRPAWRGLSDALMRDGRDDEASAVAEQCLREPRLRVEGHLILARLSIQSQDFAGARTAVERALEYAPDDRIALDCRCQILFEHGSTTDAEAALRNLLRLAPEDAPAHHNLGIIMLRCKQHEQAAQAFRQSLMHRADAPATYLYLGYALKESGRLEEAVSAWEQVLRLAPGDAAACEELRLATLIGNGASK